MFCGSVYIHVFGTNIQKVFQWKNVRRQEELQSCSFWYCIEKQGGKIKPGKEPCVNRELPNEAGKLQHCIA